MRFDGEVAIVTGGGQGLGRAFALAFAREGCRVVVADLNPATSAAVAEEIDASGGQAISVVTDVSDLASAEAMAARAMEQFGGIDILVNNAGRTTGGFKPWDELTPADWHSFIDINLTGVFNCCRAVWPAMKQQRRGKIVNIGSGAVWIGMAGWVPYTAAKSGVIGFTRALARDVGDYGVCVNAVTPGATRHEANTSLAANVEREAMTVQKRSIKRTATPEDVVGAILFLSSSESDFITGQTLNVDGGTSMH